MLEARGQGSEGRPTRLRRCVGGLVLGLLILATSTGRICALELTAHRGASHDAPENTMAAIRLAWERGADAVEIDVHLSRDGRVVVIHDDSTKRTAGHDQPVAGQTLDELRKLDAGAWKGAKWLGERIPTLEEVLPTLPDDKRVLIEVKCGPEIVPELKRLVGASGKSQAQIAIISFSLKVCVAAKQALPDHKVYLLAGFEQDKETGMWAPTAEELIARAREAEIDGLDLSHVGPVDATFVEAVRTAGLEVLAWTVDKPEDARRVLEAGIDSITTNRPAFLRETLEPKI